MEVVHVYGWELSRVLLDNLLLLLWTAAFSGLGYVFGRVHAEIKLTELAKARGEVETMTIAMKYACECFDAAEFEGLSTVLQESPDERLKDLVSRRIQYGIEAIKEYFAAAPTEGQDNGGANGN